LTQCGIFGPHGSELLRKAEARKKYLERIRKTHSTREFADILNSHKRTTRNSPPAPLRNREGQKSTVELLPQDARSTSKTILPASVPKADLIEYNMDHLAPQVKATVDLDFDHPEKNEGIFPFKNDRIIYLGERITILSFVLPVVDPRDLTNVTVTLLDNFKGFKLRQNVVPNSLIGDDERKSFILKKIDKQSKKLVQHDKCTIQDARNVIGASASSFAVFCNQMDENTSTRFAERTYKFPDGLKARPNFFGNSNSNVRIYLSAYPFTFGSASKEESFSAVAEFFIAMDLKVEKLSSVKKKDKWEELDDALQG
jgi:hypothetical protein